MNEVSRRSSLDAPPPVIGAGGYWIAGARLSIGGVNYPRGSTLPNALVAALAPARLAVMMRNLMVCHRLGVPDPAAPAAVPVVPSDPVAERKAMLAALKAAGYRDCELHAHIGFASVPGAYVGGAPMATAAPTSASGFGNAMGDPVPTPPAPAPARPRQPAQFAQTKREPPARRQPFVRRTKPVRKARDEGNGPV